MDFTVLLWYIFMPLQKIIPAFSGRTVCGAGRPPKSLMDLDELQRCACELLEQADPIETLTTALLDARVQMKPTAL